MNTETNMDVVYLVKQAELNEELRYSLRSLDNLPHGQVFFAGHAPGWINTHYVKHVINRQGANTKYLNTTNNLIAACESPAVSENFILMNDDFFVMSPIDHLPTFNRGKLDDVIAEYEAKTNSQYLIGMKQTKELMESVGLSDLKSYELHVPIVINKTKFLEVMKIRETQGLHIKAFHKRSFYGNYAKIGGESIEDVKIYDRNQPFDPAWEQSTFLSTDDGSFRYGEVGKFIRRQFKEKSKYEL